MSSAFQRGLHAHNVLRFHPRLYRIQT